MSSMRPWQRLARDVFLGDHKPQASLQCTMHDARCTMYDHEDDFLGDHKPRNGAIFSPPSPLCGRVKG